MPVLKNEKSVSSGNRAYHNIRNAMVNSKYIMSTDKVNIHYLSSGMGQCALVFVHGWLGNAGWWDAQQKYFAEKYEVVQIDLPGHGHSERSRAVWTAELYAQDIKTVAGGIDAQKIILVGHSMSGAYVLEASLSMPSVMAVILIDTLKNLDGLMTYEQAEQLILSQYRKDFRSAVENILPQYLFAGATPVRVRQQLQEEFLRNDPDLAIKVTEPLYKMDIRKTARLVNVPVRSINSDLTPTHAENNRKYFRDYDHKIISGTGHYPMLERPDEFNLLLEEILRGLGL